MLIKQIENWLYWTVVDIIGIGLYFTKGVMFVTLLYVILLFMAIRGFFFRFRASDQPDKYPAFSS